MTEQNTPPANPAATPPDEETLTIPKGAFAERLARHHRTQLRETFGTEDATELKSRLERLAAYEAAEEERRKAQMTEIERAKAEAEEARVRAAKLEQELDARAFEARVAAACAAKGIRNTEYAMFSVIQAAESLGEGGSLDLDSYLAERLADPMTRAALGVESAPPVVATPATTTPVTSPGAAPPPPGVAPPAPSAFDLDTKAWAARKQALGLR